MEKYDLPPAEVNPAEVLRATFIAYTLYTRPDPKKFNSLINIYLPQTNNFDRKKCFYLIISYFLVTGDLEKTTEFVETNIKKNKFSKLIAAEEIVTLCFCIRKHVPRIPLEKAVSFAQSLLETEQNLKKKVFMLTEVIALLNGLNLEAKAIQAAEQCLRILPQIKLDSISLSELYYNIGCIYSDKIITAHQAIPYLKEALSFNPNDPDILKDYVSCLCNEQQFELAANVCDQSSLKSASDIKISIKCLDFTIPDEEIFSLSIEDFSMNGIQIMILDSQAIRYARLNNPLSDEKALLSYQLAMEWAGSEREIQHAIAKLLNHYLRTNQFKLALNILADHTKADTQFLSHSNIILKCYASLTYLVNNLSNEAEDIIKNIASSTSEAYILSEIYIYFYLIFLENKNVFSVDCLRYAIQLNPHNEKAIIYHKIFSSSINNANENNILEVKEEEKFDAHLVNKFLIENDLIKDKTEAEIIDNKVNLDKHEKEEEEDEIDIGSYDPIKLHRFFQEQKNTQLLFLTDMLMPPPKNKWVVNGISYIEGRNGVASLNAPLFYPNYFGVISPELSLDQKVFSQFKIALEKGLCRREFHSNGVKFLDGIIELKAHTDTRLYTSTVYKNKQNGHLFILDKFGNHHTIAHTLKTNKPKIQIINLDDNNNTLQSNFFKSISQPHSKKESSECGEDKFFLK